MLGAFRSSLPQSVSSSLTTTSSRQPDTSNISHISSRGISLWDSIYRPFETKLIDKLAESHPDLPVHIVNSHYGALLSDPSDRPSTISVGRVTTSLVAVACLRAQTGVGPQVTSHIFGLRKAVEDGTWKTEEAVLKECGEEGVTWLASDEGSGWILETVDGIVAAISEGKGSTYAPGKPRESKL